MSGGVLYSNSTLKMGSYLAALALGVALLHSPVIPLVLAPLAIGVVVGFAAGSGKEAFAVGGLIGFLSLVLVLGADIGRALGIVAGIAGGLIAVLVVLYHVLTPAFVSGAVRLLRG